MLAGGLENRFHHPYQLAPGTGECNRRFHKTFWFVLAAFCLNNATDNRKDFFFFFSSYVYIYVYTYICTYMYIKGTGGRADFYWVYPSFYVMLVSEEMF